MFFLDLWQIILVNLIIRIHIPHIIFGGSAQHLDDLQDMIETWVSYEEWSSIENFKENAA